MPSSNDAAGDLERALVPGPRHRVERSANDALVGHAGSRANRSRSALGTENPTGDTTRAATRDPRATRCVPGTALPNMGGSPRNVSRIDTVG